MITVGGGKGLHSRIAMIIEPSFRDKIQRQLQSQSQPHHNEKENGIV